MSYNWSVNDEITADRLNKMVDWRLVSAGTFTSSTNITGLSGDTDKVYKLIIRASKSSSYFHIYLRFNNDSGSGNYEWVSVSAAYYDGSVHTDGQHSASDKIYLSRYYGMGETAQQIGFYEITIYAKSGVKRAVISNSVVLYGSDFGTGQIGATWSNTSDEITQINIVLDTTIDSGEYWLYTMSENT